MEVFDIGQKLHMLGIMAEWLCMQLPQTLALFNQLACSPPPFLFLFSLKGDALLDAGESMKRLAEVKDSLDIEVKQNFIDPLQNLCDKDLKEIQVNATVLSLLFISLDAGLFWLSVHVTTCSITVENNVDRQRYHFCSPACDVHSLSIFPSICSPDQCIQHHCHCSSAASTAGCRLE